MKPSIVYQFLFFSIIITSFGCHQTNVNEGVNLTSKTKPIKSESVKKERTSEQPSVIYQSNNLGRNWSSFDEGIPKNATLSGIKQYGNHLYVTTDYHGVFVSKGGQNNWKELNTERLQGLDINCIEVEKNKIVVGTLKNGIFVSDDAGLTWKSPEKNNIKSSIRAFIKLENKLYAGTDSGIFESDDMGDTWSHLFGQMQILGFTVLNNKIYAATQSGALMYSSDSWKYIYEGDALHDIGNDGKYIYAMTIGQELLKTKDDGVYWENAQNGITRPPNFYTNELQHIGNDIFSAQWVGIYHSSDNGNSWRMLDDLPKSTAFSTLEVTDFGIIAGISIR